MIQYVDRKLMYLLPITICIKKNFFFFFQEPCLGLLKCGHKCNRECHPIHHKNEVHYICDRPCGGQRRPEGCQHDCPNLCYECENLGKCPPCNKVVRIKLSCDHIKSMPCRMAFNVDRMDVECNMKKMFTFNCGHS